MHGRNIAGVSAAGLLSAILLFSSSALAQAPLERITLGYPATAMSHFPVFVGREFGQFREEGLEVQLVRVSGNVVVAALLAGELGYTTSADATVRSAVLGLPIKMLAAIGVKPSLSLIVRPEIKTATASRRDRKSTRLNSSHANIYTLSLHDALPIFRGARAADQNARRHRREAVAVFDRAPGNQDSDGFTP